MIDRDYCVLMAEYNAWINTRLYAICADLDDAERKKDVGAFFRSIHGTLNHLMWADRAFLIRLLGWDLPMGQLGDVLFEDFAAMREERARFDGCFVDWAKKVDDGYLSEPYEFRSVAYQRRRRMPRYLMVAQMFNHQTHHRGQLTTLLAQRGIEFGTTDLPWMPYSDAICEELPF